MEFIDKYKDRKDNYSLKINNSDYLENILNKENNKINDGYNDICEIYLSRYDINYQILNENEKENYLIKKKIEIASKINNYNYNRKINENIISNGFQDINNFSSILYLNDYFNCNLIIYNDGLNRYYKTGLKNKELLFCIYKNNKWINYDNNNNDNINFYNYIELRNIINFDIDTNEIYNLYLKSISKYKMDDLIKICSDNNIDIMNKNKKKKKKELYDEINIKKLNE